MTIYMVGTSFFNKYRKSCEHENFQNITSDHKSQNAWERFLAYYIFNKITLSRYFAFLLCTLLETLFYLYFKLEKRCFVVYFLVLILLAYTIYIYKSVNGTFLSTKSLFFLLILFCSSLLVLIKKMTLNIFKTDKYSLWIGLALLSQNNWCHFIMTLF